MSFLISSSVCKWHEEIKQSFDTLSQIVWNVLFPSAAGFIFLHTETLQKWTPLLALLVPGAEVSMVTVVGSCTGKHKCGETRAEQRWHRWTSTCKMLVIYCCTGTTATTMHAIRYNWKTGCWRKQCNATLHFTIFTLQRKDHFGIDCKVIQSTNDLHVE